MEDTNTTKKAIHEKLICDLSTGFFGDSPLVSGNKDRWRVYCTLRYRLPAHQHESVLDDLRYLELNSFIGVGKYEVLLEIFDKVDRRAIPVINMAWDSIRQNNETERNRQREPKPGDRIAFTAKITVRANNRSKQMHKDITEILTHFADGPESALSSALTDNANRLSPGNNLEPLVNNFVRKNNQSEEMSTYILEESRGLFRAMKSCHRVESCQIYSGDGCVVISVGFVSKEDKMRACNDEENKLKKKIKNTFKIFFTLVNARSPQIEVKIMD